MPLDLSEAPPRAEIVTRARVLRVTLRPTPQPTPPLPTRNQPLVAASRAPATARMQEGRSGGRVATRGTDSAAPAPARPSNSRPVWDVTSGRPGSAAMLAGNGPAAGAGNGLGTHGSGNDAATVDEPCGFVTFSDPHGSQFDPSTRGFWVDIRMSVHFAGGASESMILDYPWYYPSEAANPWSDQNLRDPDFPMRFQRPPTEKIAAEPTLVKYVMERSTPDGMTLLRECPTPTPPA